MLETILTCIAILFGILLGLTIIAAIISLIIEFCEQPKTIKKSIIKIILCILILVLACVLTIKYVDNGIKIIENIIESLPFLCLIVFAIMFLYFSLSKAYNKIRIFLKDKFEWGIFIPTMAMILLFCGYTFYMFQTRNNIAYWIYSFITSLIIGFLSFLTLSLIYSKFSLHKNIKRFCNIINIIFICIIFICIPNYLTSYNYNHFIEKRLNEEKQVYVTKYGKKYHYFKKCKSLKQSKEIYKISIYDAFNDGYTECKICEKNIIH